MNDRFSQKDVAGILLLSAAVGAAGILGAITAKTATASIDKKALKRWWRDEVAPHLLHAGLITSRRMVSWFDKRVVTIDQLKPGMNPQKRVAAVDRVATVMNKFVV